MCEITDPRLDLTTDSRLWSELLRRAAAVDQDDPNGLYGALDGLRCLGAGLIRDSRGLRLVPGEIDRAEYAELRAKWLVPHSARLKQLLSGAGFGLAKAG